MFTRRDGSSAATALRLGLARWRRAPMPAITHQTAPTSALTPDQADLRARMIALNPGWAHRFYDDAACRETIRRHLPRLLPTYEGYPTPIQRADMFRVAAVYLFGGVYLDLDMDSLAPLASLRRHRCVLAEEKTLSAEAAQALGHAERLRIANYMFASAPGHRIWRDLLAAMAARAARPIQCDDDILETTGPGLFSTLYGKVGARYPDIVVLAHPGRTCARCGGASCQFGDYAAHLHHGSWRAF